MLLSVTNTGHVLKFVIKCNIPVGEVALYNLMDIKHNKLNQSIHKFKIYIFISLENS